MQGRRGEQPEHMSQSIFIKVIGFSDVERHALDTVLRLSQPRPTSYCLWGARASQGPQLAILDGQSHEARLEAEATQSRQLPMVWIGEQPPEKVWRSFRRPVAWSQVVQAMDELFTPTTDIEFDLDLEGAPTLPPDDEPPPRAGPRGLIAAADLHERLYLRAKMALHGMPLADEAENASQLQELLRDGKYQLAVVDFALPQGGGWALVRQLAQARPAIGGLLVAKERATLADRVRARFAGAQAMLEKPFDPGRLQSLIEGASLGEDHAGATPEARARSSA